MKITVDLDEIRRLARKGGDILLSPEGEAALLKLLDARDAVEEALTEAKRLIAREAEGLNPNCSCIRADHLTIYYRPYGPKYRLDHSRIPELSPSLYKSQTSLAVVTRAVEALMEAEGKLPAGIIPLERPKQIVISRKEAPDGAD